MLLKLDEGWYQTIECMTLGHGRCRDIDCECACHPITRVHQIRRDMQRGWIYSSNIQTHMITVVIDWDRVKELGEEFNRREQG